MVDIVFEGVYFYFFYLLAVEEGGVVAELDVRYMRKRVLLVSCLNSMKSCLKLRHISLRKASWLKPSTKSLSPKKV